MADGAERPVGQYAPRVPVVNTKKLSNKAHESIFPTRYSTCFSGPRVQHQTRNDFARQSQSGLLFELSAEQGESA